MRLLNDQFDLDRFFERVAAAPQSVLMLDYDGTLAPFRKERDQAIPYSGVRERLSRLVELSSTRLVLVTGRASDDLIPLLGLAELPEIWGCHGAERLLPGCQDPTVELEPEVRQGLKTVRGWAVAVGLESRAEFKPACVAFHWRGLSDSQVDAIRGVIVNKWLDSAADFGLQLVGFDGGLELRAAKIDKGRTVREIVGETGPGSPSAYLGDDLTDENAFASVPVDGLKVLVRPEMRDTRADLWLAPPEELLVFLDRWIATRN